MTYKIIGDSCLDLTEEMKKDPKFQMVPLTLQVGDAQVVDDETFDQKAFIRMVIFTCLCGWFGSSPSAAHAGTERMLGLRRIPGAYFNEKEPFNFTRPLYFVT